MPPTNPSTLHPNPSLAALPYNPALALWLSVDPLSDKYPGVSPYVYCGNNPVRYFDPNGKEKIDALTNNKKNSKHKEVIQNYPENDGVIHLWAHGNPYSIEICGIPYDASQTDWLDFYLQAYSKVYSSNSSKSQTSILVLHSCETGREEKNNIAQQLSLDLNLLVVAPSESLMAINVPKMGYCEDGVYTEHKESVYNSNCTPGCWNVYYKGMLIDSLDGMGQPIFENPQETIQYYEKLYNSIYNEDL